MKNTLCIVLATVAALAIVVACGKDVAEPETSTGSDIPDGPGTFEEAGRNTFSVEKEAWTDVATKGGNADIQWKVGDEVTIYTDDGKFHNFKVKESHGMNAIFDCEDNFWNSQRRYKLYFPSLAAGWLTDGEYVLSYGYHPTNNEHKVADWMASDWVKPSDAKHMSFVLKHLSSMVTLSMEHPQAGVLRQCYLCAVPLDFDHNTEPYDEKASVFGYKIDFVYHVSDFVLDFYGKADDLPLMFDKEKTFKNGEVMVSETPMYTDALADVACNLILVYADGNVYAAPIKLHDMEAGKNYTIRPASAFVKVDKEPDCSFHW